MSPDEAAPETLHLDLRGLKCPLPVLHTRKALARAQPGTRIVVRCTDPMAAIDIPHLATRPGTCWSSRASRTGSSPLY